MNLDLYLFGNSLGESMLLHLPNEYAAVIDCYDYSPESLLRKKIEELKITKLDLLVITHPHTDHFKDSEILERELQPTKLCTYGHHDLRSLGAYYKAFEERVERTQKKFSYFRSKSPTLSNFRNISDIYTKFSSMLQLSARSRSTNHITVTNSTFVDIKNNLEISAVGPIGLRAESIESNMISILKFMTEDPIQNRHSADNDLINQFSVVLKVKFGDSALLLCGDANKDSLERIVEYHNNNPTLKILDGISVVKVPHHGSERDNTSLFWSKLAHCSPNARAICTYYRSCLPQESAFLLIHQKLKSQIVQPKAKDAKNANLQGTIASIRTEYSNPLKVSFDLAGTVVFY